MSKLKKLLSYVLFIALLTVSLNEIKDIEAATYTYTDEYTYSDYGEYHGKFDYKSINMNQGESVYIDANIYNYWGDVIDANSDEIDLYDFYSMNTNVAKVDSSSGKITGVGPGTTTVYLHIYFNNSWDDELIISCTVYVSGTNVVLNYGNDVSLNIGKTKKLTVQKYSLNGSATKFTSSNTSVATVDSSGVVKAKKPGKSTITVSCTLNGRTYTSKCTVTVHKPYLNETVIYPYKKGTFKLKVSGSTGKAVWKSSNKKVATVKNGKVKAKKKGKATITCKVNGITLKCKVRVQNPWLSSKDTTITDEFTRQLYIYGHSRKGKWSVKNSSIATVSKKGVIKAKKPGTTTVYCKTDGVKLKCKVTVTVNDIRFTPNYTSLESVSYDTVKFDCSELYFDGNKLKLKGKLYNKTASKLKKLPYASFKLYINSKLVLTKELYNQSVNMKSFSTKNVTFTLANNSYYKKNIDLNNSSVRIVYDVRKE